MTTIWDRQSNEWLYPLNLRSFACYIPPLWNVFISYNTILYAKGYVRQREKFYGLLNISIRCKIIRALFFIQNDDQKCGNRPEQQGNQKPIQAAAIFPLGKPRIDERKRPPSDEILFVIHQRHLLEFIF